MMIAFSPIETADVRLPAGNDNTSTIHIFAHIRDTLDCVTEFNLSSVVVVPDIGEINSLVDTLQNSSIPITNNPLVRILASCNQNTISQVMSSLSQEFNKINSQTIGNAVASK